MRDFLWLSSRNNWDFTNPMWQEARGANEAAEGTAALGGALHVRKIDQTREAEGAERSGVWDGWELKDKRNHIIIMQTISKTMYFG